MSTTLKIGYLRLLRKLKRDSIIAKSVFGYPYRISLGDTFSENPYYNAKANVGEVLATAAWVLNGEKPVIFDVGGHCGFIASQLAYILKKRQPAIYSFEPVAPTFSDLVHTITELSLQEFIHPVSVAVSSKAGFVRLNYSRWSSMLAQIISDQAASNKRSGDEIYLAPSQTLDEFSKSVSYPQVIKVDVEGWEVHVFKGAENILTDKRVINIGICLEWNPEALKDTGFSAEQLYVCLKDFRFFYINDYQGQEYPPLEEIKSPLAITHVCNFFLIHEQSGGVEQWKKNFEQLKAAYSVRVS